MPFHIIRNDITKMTTDAIVNATNTQLKAGGGVCGAIFAAAGYDKMTAACDNIGYCAIGGAVITNGFDLPARFVIHTAGPIYGLDPQNEAKQLFSCYTQSLELAKSKRLRSISFPLISSGIYGYPKREAMDIATRAVRDFLKDNDIDVYLVVYDDISFDIGREKYDSIKSYIDARLVRQQQNRAKQLQKDIRRLHSYHPNEDLRGDFPAWDHALPKTEYAPAAAKLSLSDKLKARQTETFSQMLLRMIDDRGMTDVEVYKRANIDRKLFSKIRKKDYVPKKSTIAALAISLRLDLDNTKDLLMRAGYAFSDASTADLIIEYFIETGNYDIFEINEALFSFGQPTL